MSITVRAVLVALVATMTVVVAAPANAASYCTFRDGVVTAHVPAGHFVRLLLGRAGNDELDAWGIDSVLVGGRGKDILSGTAAPMTYLAGPGDDVIHANTLVIDHLVDGGDGYDIGFVDPGDPLVGVEELRNRSRP
jgi:Ca2+-binding RTX toxin-like protein